jgi:hypothetical protein
MAQPNLEQTRTASSAPATWTPNLMQQWLVEAFATERRMPEPGRPAWPGDRLTDNAAA